MPEPRTCRGCGRPAYNGRRGRFGCANCVDEPGDGWQHRAACWGHPTPELFDSLNLLDAVDALAVCERCPVVRECDALAVHHEAAGTWGGLARGLGRGVPHVTFDEAWDRLDRATEPDDVKLARRRTAARTVAA
jgi:hypothetical protein